MNLNQIYISTSKHAFLLPSLIHFILFDPYHVSGCIQTKAMLRQRVRVLHVYLIKWKHHMSCSQVILMWQVPALLCWNTYTCVVFSFIHSASWIASSSDIEEPLRPIQSLFQEQWAQVERILDGMLIHYCTPIHLVICYWGSGSKNGRSWKKPMQIWGEYAQKYHTHRS